jgi:hypothetical protein
VSLKKLFASIVVLTVTGGAIVAAVGGDDAGSIPRSSAYAYITERQIVVMQGDRAVARVPRVFDAADPSANKVVWSNNGRFVALFAGATLRQEPPEDEQLIAIDAGTGRVSRAPCPRCYDLTPIDDQKILASDYGGSAGGPPRSSEFDLGSMHSAVVTPDLPSDGLTIRLFLASASDLVMTARAGYVAGTYAQQIEATRVSDSSRVDYGYFPSNEYMPAAATGVGAGESPKFAVAFRQNPGECVAQFPVVVFEPDRGPGARLDTDMSAAEPAGHAPGGQGGIEVNDLWWGADGHLYATIASWTCDQDKRAEDEQMVPAHRSSVWRLEGRRWIEDGTDHATMVRQIDPATRVELTIPDCIGRDLPPNPTVSCNAGVLYRVHEGTRIPVARNVISISAPSP